MSNDGHCRTWGDGRRTRPAQAKLDSEDCAIQNRMPSGSKDEAKAKFKFKEPQDNGETKEPEPWGCGHKETPEKENDKLGETNRRERGSGREDDILHSARYIIVVFSSHLAHSLPPPSAVLSSILASASTEREN